MRGFCQKAKMKRSAREHCCSRRPQALRCCAAGCGSRRAFRLACGGCQGGFRSYAPGGANTGEDRRRAVFISSMARALWLCHAVSASVVQLARNRRCESCE